MLYINLIIVLTLEDIYMYLFAQMMLHKPFRLAYSKNINKG